MMGKRPAKKKRADRDTAARTIAHQKAPDSVTFALNDDLVRNTRIVQMVNQRIDSTYYKYIELFSDALYPILGGLLLVIHIIDKDVSAIFLVLWIIQLLSFIVYFGLKFWTPESMIYEKDLWRKGRICFVFRGLGMFAFLVFGIVEWHRILPWAFSLTVFFLTIAFSIILAISRQPSRLTNISLTRLGSYCVFAAYLCYMTGWFLHFYVSHSLFVYVLGAAYLGSIVIGIWTLYFAKPRDPFNYIQTAAMGIISPVSISLSLASARETMSEKILGLQTIQPLIDQGRWMALSAINREILEHLPQKRTLLDRIASLIVGIALILVALNRDFMISILEPILQKAFTQAFAIWLCKWFNISCDFRM